MRLLIVEDNAELSRLVAGGLAAAGYQSDIVGSAAETGHGQTAASRPAYAVDIPTPSSGRRSNAISGPSR